MNKSSLIATQPKAILTHLLAITVLSSYIMAFMEWLFLVTKPSFLDNWTFLERIETLFIAPIYLIFFQFIIFACCLIFTSIIPWKVLAKSFLVAFVIVPSVTITAIALMMFENFTYTLFQFNAGSFIGPQRYLYALAILILALFLCKKLLKWANSPFLKARGQYLKGTTILLVSISTLLTLAKLNQTGFDDLSSGNMISSRELPNILILSTDGLEASSMSAYGYHRDTTPFIRELVPQSLLVENHFSNNAKSTGSIGALFSGKMPTTTGVIYPPDIFNGKDTYQHMPAILKKIGYQVGDISIRHYTDPYDLNMREGFDYANGRRVTQISGRIQFPEYVRRAFTNESYFLENVLSKLLVRIEHVLSISNMVNPYILVADMKNAQRHFPDSKRISQLFDFIDNSQSPFFVHLHLMITHGSKFNLNKEHFSLGQTQSKDWMTDFYDDSILNYDLMVQEIVKHLKEKDRFDNTLIIITSDHGKRWQANVRIPLILRFPKQKYVGVRHNNVQRIDVTATILDYLGLDIPNWMEGESFLRGEFKPTRPIFFADSAQWGPQDSGGWRKIASYKAPYYSLGGVGVIIAQQWHYLDLAKSKFYSGYVKDHTAPIAPHHFPSKHQILNFLVDHLASKNYPTPNAASQ